MAYSNIVNGHAEASNSSVRASVLHGVKDLRIVRDLIRIYSEASTHMIYYRKIAASLFQHPMRCKLLYRPLVSVAPTFTTTITTAMVTLLCRNP